MISKTQSRSAIAGLAVLGTLMLSGVPQVSANNTYRTHYSPCKFASTYSDFGMPVTSPGDFNPLGQTTMRVMALNDFGKCGYVMSHMSYYTLVNRRPTLRGVYGWADRDIANAEASAIFLSKAQVRAKRNGSRYWGPWYVRKNVRFPWR